MTRFTSTRSTIQRRRAVPLRGMLLGSTVLVAVAQQAAAQPAINAQPQGGKVVAGTATIGQTATLTQINQSSQRAAVNWSSFDVGSNQQVQFQQPSASAMTLNRVTGPDPSQIAGKITANGQVVLVNPAGVLFTKGAQVQAQSVVVSAAGISNENFMAGRMVFDQPARPDAAVVNQGRITVKQTGLAALVAPRVENDGVISARLGHVVLGGAETATLDLYGDGLLSFDVTGQVKQAKLGNDGKTAAALVTNTGTVLADGGTVLLTASAVDGVVQTLVTAGGKISAPSVGGQTGRIAVRGTGGAVLVTGGVLAQGGQSGTTGGQIELNATGAVQLASTARVDASGQAGGGTIAVGTTLARAKGGVTVTPKLTAVKTTVAAGATIAADATTRGNGGQVTVLSSEGTSMAGRTTSRGGPQGGDGGSVEISANHGLTITGTVDTRAPAGKIGLLTIDPNTLTIGDNVVTANPAAPAPDGSNQPATGAQTISAATFNAFATNVSLQATGDITLGGSTTLATATTGASLTLNAGGTLAINVALNQPGAVTLTGTNGIAINAPISLGNNTLTLNGGSITQSATAIVTAGTLIGNIAGAVDLSTAPNIVQTLGPFTATGNFSLTNEVDQPLTVNGRFSANGNIALNTSGIGALSMQGAVTTTANNATITLTSGSGGIALNAAVGAATGTTGTIVNLITTGGGNVTQTAASVITAAELIGNVSGSVVLATLSPFGGGFVVTPSPSNNIAAIGPFTVTGGNFWLTNATDQNLTVSGALTANNVTLINQLPLTTASTGSISVATSGSISAGNFGIVSLQAGTGGISLNGPVGGPSNTTVDLATASRGGAVTQTPSGPITAAQLGLDASAVTLTAAGNKISGFYVDNNTVDECVCTTGDLKVFSTAPLIVGTGNPAQPVFSSNGIVYLATSNAAGISFTNGPVSGKLVTLQADALVGLGTTGAIGNVTAETFELAPYTAGKPITLGAASGLSLTDLTGVTITSPAGAGTIRIGAVTQPGNTAPTTTAGSIVIAGTGFSVGANTLDLNTTLSGGGTGAITQTNTGVITAGTLTGKASGAVNLSTTSNAVATLGPLTATGDFSLTNGANQNLTVTGPLSANNIMLGTSGTGALSVQGAVTTSGNNATITLTGGSGGIALNAAVGAGAGTTGTIVDLITTGGGDVTQTAAPSGITAAELVGNVSGSVVMATLVGGAVGSPGPSNYIAALGPFTVNGAGGFVLDASSTFGTLTVNGPLTATGGGVAIIRPNALAVPGTITANGLVELDAFVDGLTITGNVKGPTIFLDSEVNGSMSLSGNSSIGQSGATITLAAAGGITQDPTSVITAGTLQVSLANSVDLVGTGNAIDTLGHVTTFGFIHLTDKVSLTVSGSIQLFSGFSGDDISLRSANDVTVSTSLSAPGPVTVQAGGNLLVAGGAPIRSTFGDISLSAASPAIAGFNPAGKLTLNSDVAASGGTVQLAAGSGGVALGAKVSGTTGVDLTTTGGGLVSQTTAAIIAAGTLTGNASGALDLSTATNAVSNLGSFTAGGNFALNNGTNALQFTGAFVGGGTLALTAGPISQSANAAITTGTLTGSSSGAVDLGAATNAIANLGAFTAGGNFTLNNGTNALQFTGAFAGSGDTLVLNAGPITQTAGGAITAGTLTGSSSGTVDLSTATNAIANLGAFTPGGNFALNNGTNALQFTGAFAGGSNTLTLNAGAITETTVGAITAGTFTGNSSGNVDLRSASNAIATLGTLAAAGTIDLQQSSPLNVTGPVSASDIILDVPGPTGGLIFSGPLTATGGLFLIAGDQGIALNAGAALSAVTAKLGAGAGGVSEAAGASLTVDSLQVSGPPIGGTVDLRQGTNAVSTLGPFQVAAGDFYLVQSRPLSVVGQVSANTINLVASGAAAGITVSAPMTAANNLVLTGGDVVLNGAITTPDLHIDANGTITQTGGSLAVGTLSGSAVHLADFAINANIATLGAFTVTGSTFVLNTAGPLTIAGPLSAQYIAITAQDQVTLTGTIATLGLPVAQQSGTQPASPGSFITVLPGASGSGRFVTTGLAAFVPLGASNATVRIDVPGNGGQIIFDPPFAPQVFLILDTGIGGRSSGTLDVGGLLVLGSGGSATLFGTVDGFGGFGAATVSQISPRVDAAYTVNGCVIATSTCLSIQQNLLQAQAAAYSAVALQQLLVPLSLLAVPQLPAPLGWLLNDDVVPPNISEVDY